MSRFQTLLRMAPIYPALYAQILRQHLARDVRVVSAVVMELPSGEVEESVIWFGSNLSQARAEQRHRLHQDAALKISKQMAKEKWRSA